MLTVEQMNVKSYDKLSNLSGSGDLYITYSSFISILIKDLYILMFIISDNGRLQKAARGVHGSSKAG